MPRDLGLDSNRTNDGNRGRDYSPIVVDKEGIADSDAKAGGPFEIVSVDHTTTASPDNKSGSDDEDDVRMSNYGSFFRRPVMSDKTNQRDELHPYTSILTLSDVDDCVKLEEAAFPENERCSREKVFLSPECIHYASYSYLLICSPWFHFSFSPCFFSTA